MLCGLNGSIAPQVGFRNTVKVESVAETKCETCTLGKLKKSSLLKRGKTNVQGPLELSHLDVVGKITSFSRRKGHATSSHSFTPTLDSLQCIVFRSKQI